MLPCIGSQTQATVTPAAVTFSTRFGSASRIRAGAHPGDEGQPAGLVVGVELGGERERVVGRRGRAELDADRVADVREQLDVRAVELAGALADPDEVAGDVVGLLGARVDAGQRVLVLQDQRLVAGVEVDPVELVGVGADGLHERQRPVDLPGQLLVARRRPESCARSRCSRCAPGAGRRSRRSRTRARGSAWTRTSGRRRPAAAGPAPGPRG